ncbi:28S ribosomal protein S18b, mitochondrial [Meleagris gallopavo]|uniref:Small ribosomal subunit protein mS40 n=1 Tax=Meleagris gallopavo TaxID=9103 RepID=A0A803YEP2_MELGA|nr:28S ribosomal protein S18b, mitochondrial [Meleagris gallopavo]
MGRTGREFGGSWENWEGIWREWKGTGRTGKEFEGDWEGIWGHWDGFYGRASHHFPPPKRKGKRVGNPCPICRDQNLHVDFRNVKLLEQFVCPHSGSIFHPTHTGVCMKQHKLLLKAIAQAQDHGLLWLRVPFVPTPSDDYLTQHSAVGKTPPGPQLREGRVWYPWYEWQQPPAAAIARLRRIYKDYLKEEEAGGGAAVALGEGQKAESEMGVEGQKGGVEGQKGGTEG